MYERFYGFGERPFSLLPDPDFLFLSRNHQTALDLLELAIYNHSGFCVISGEIGAGKTTLIRELLNRLDDRLCVGLVSNTHPSFGELLQWIMAAYGLHCDSQDKLELHKRFIDFVIAQYADNRHTLLIIDEAQNLTTEALEELRMLSNVNSDKDFILQIILVGQQQLRDRLREPQLQQFAQRISLDYHLDSLGREETADYIRHRLRHAGGSPSLFSGDALLAVYEHTGGIPRLINRLCDLCLVYGYSDQREVIDAGLVERVAEDQRMGALSCEEPAQAGGGGESVPATPEEVVPDRVDEDSPTVARAEPPPGEGTTETPRIAEAEPADTPQEAAEEAAEPSPPELPAYHEDRETAGPPASERAARETAPDPLHQLVVDAEQRRDTGRRGAQWLLLAVVTLVGLTAWGTRELWLQSIQSTFQQLASDTRSAVRRTLASETGAGQPVEPAVSVAGSKQLDNETARAEQAKAEQAKAEQARAEQAKAEQARAEQARAEQARAEQARAEQARAEQAKAERAKAERARAEAARLEETRRQQLALKREAERLRRLQQEAERLERERRAAEQELARQKAERLALERKARLEQQRARAAREAAAKREAERLRAERLRQEAQRAEAPSPPQRQAAVPAAARPVAQGMARSGVPAVEAGGGRHEPEEEDVSVEDNEPSLQESEAVAEAEAPARFSNNPCKGPTARFMSTCR